MLCQNASTVWPDSVRPEASTIVPEMITGSRSPSSSNSDSTAKIAALAFSVSKIVSMSRMSAPPSTRPRRGVVIGLLELRPRDAPGGRVADVRADRCGPVRRPEGAGDETRATGLGGFGRVGSGASEPGGRHVELADDARVEAVVGLGDPGRRKGVGRDDVGARFEVGGMDRLDGRRSGQRQEIVVAAQVSGMIAEPVAAERRLVELVRLEHRAHRAVEDQDALRQEPGQPGTSGSIA